MSEKFVWAQQAPGLTHGTQPVYLNIICSRLCTALMWLPCFRNELLPLGLLGVASVGLSVDFVEPRAPIENHRVERSHALSAKNVRIVQMPTQIENFHSASIRPVHFEIGDHPSADRAVLRIQTLTADLIAKRKHVVDAFFQFRFATRLSFADVSSKVAIRYSLSAL